MRLRNNAAKSRMDLEDFAAAEAAWREVAEESAKLSYQDLEAAALKNLAVLLLEQTYRAPASERTRAAREALSLFGAARDLLSEQNVVVEVAGCLLGIARSYRRLGETEQATLHAEEALALARKARARELERQILTLLGALVADLDLDRAIAHYETALTIVEQQRKALSSRDLRSSFFSRRRQPYVDAALLLLQKEARAPGSGYAEQSFLLSERAKARALVDYLEAAGVDSRPSQAPEVWKRFRDAEKLLNLRERQWKRRLTSGDSSAVEAAKQAAEAARRDLDQVTGELARADPRLAVLTGGRTASLPEIRQRFAGPGAVLIAYLLGEEESLVYAMTAEELLVRRLPAKRAIEAEVERFVAALAAGDLPASSALAEPGAQRLGTLLLEPVAETLGSARTVHVVGDGVLHGLPFAALRVGSKLLVETHNLVQLPSASASVLLSENAESRNLEAALLVGGASNSKDAARGDALASGSAVRAAPPNLRPLRYSASEIAAVRALWPGSAVVLTGTEASVDGVLGQALDRFGLLHFAVHAVLDVRRPGASGLVLASPEEEEGVILGARDLYRLSLNADLVTLSACRSALGRPIEGEGFNGLTTAFLYAGARNVLATLWSVDDQATAAFMKVFYSGLIRDRLAASEALRQAQLALRASPDYAGDYYWAPFVLIGTGS